jgi:hypothetical protein
VAIPFVRKRLLPTGTATSATPAGRCVFRLGKTSNNAVAEAISFERKIDSDAVSFHFGVQFTVGYHLASSAVEEVGGLSFATALLTEDGDTAEDFDFQTLAGRFGDVSHSGSPEHYKDYKLYRNSVRPAIAQHPAEEP